MVQKIVEIWVAGDESSRTRDPAIAMPRGIASLHTENPVAGFNIKENDSGWLLTQFFHGVARSMGTEK